MPFRIDAPPVFERFDHPRLAFIALVAVAAILVGTLLRWTTASAWGFRTVVIGVILMLYAVTGFIAFFVYEHAKFE